MRQFPARIHGLLAPQAPLGVIIRRGPSKQVATILWDRRQDTFQLGQWLKGRIYERRSDLSPDGQYLIYFAMNGHWQSEAQGSWTAISQAPYLKALTLFPKGDCWQGGGLWTGHTRYWLNGCHDEALFNHANKLRRDLKFQPSTYFGAECTGVYYPRLLRDGWQLLEQREIAKWQSQDIFEKPLGHGWRLRKIAHAEVGAPVGKGCYWDEHQLRHPASGTTQNYPDWEWAELDGDRLVWAEHGKLLAGRIHHGGLSQATELFDFNPMQFQPRQAPY
ncbi:hypothetical protein [Leptolyngbya iicbica]|uniref:Uncharacterized protein n=2 Tax=Cyanophyceae TaxID=3028117 RepID=A0A4Q7E677_9CYAN|nr:hypothetical protein [Leptolyngbya sp. LK]RZM77703.1 hypothetical protein DYY88_14060 [Leptolyngbya sp. LK]